MLSKFWASATDHAFKVLVFQSVVVMALLSGLVSFALRPADYQVFARTIAAKCRVLLKGSATHVYLSRDKEIESPREHRHVLEERPTRAVR